MVLLGWVLTTHCLRLLALWVLHECAHGGFTGKKKWDDRIGMLLGVLVLGQSFASYKPEHRKDHHGTGFMTEDDPTIRFLRTRLGLTLGMSRLECWTRLFACILSPWFNLVQTKRRLESCWSTNGLHRWMMVIYMAGCVLMVVHWPMMVTVAWLIPLVFLTNVSVTVRACFEHCYPPPSIERIHSRQGISLCTHGVFFGSMSPQHGRSQVMYFVAWCWWMVCMVGHAVARACFCPGESPAHDFHHRHPVDGICPDPLYARQAALVALTAQEPDYTEVWSLPRAIDECFRSIEMYAFEQCE